MLTFLAFLGSRSMLTSDAIELMRTLNCGFFLADFFYLDSERCMEFTFYHHYDFCKLESWVKKRLSFLLSLRLPFCFARLPSRYFVWPKNSSSWLLYCLPWISLCGLLTVSLLIDLTKRELSSSSVTSPDPSLIEENLSSFVFVRRDDGCFLWSLDVDSWLFLIADFLSLPPCTVL